jgi:uncharacterized UPF0160 family protein
MDQEIIVDEVIEVVEKVNEKVDEKVHEKVHEEVDEKVILYSDDFNDKCVQVLKQDDINDFNELTKMCNIFFYYETNKDEKFCSTCFLRVADLYSRARAVRLHETARYTLLEGKTCCNCRCSLYQILSCSVCPICEQ